MIRIGTGYDVHRLDPERRLVLGGVLIPDAPGLAGHSDADVLCHAIADAILGALGMGDIGVHFPNTDPSIEGISSLEILCRVRSMLEQRKPPAGVVQVDSTLVAERPKISPYLFEMKAKIAVALGIEPEMVGVKATTNEGMGFIGRGEGMAAIAVAQVIDL
jgi:2-C-methyl-D-erythritol 2,4-cyclodiphosphate synthase